MKTFGIDEIIGLLHKWRDLKLIQDEQLELLLQTEELQKHPAEAAPEPPSHRSIMRLFDDICLFVKNGTGIRVISADNAGLRRLGWSLFDGANDVQYYDINIWDAKNTGASRVRLNSPNGRRELAKLLEQGINPLK